MLIISMISCAYPTYNSIGGREIIIERRRVIPVFTESDGQQQLLIMTFKYIATLGTAEKSESISSVTRITNNVNKGEIGHPAISPDGKEIVFQYWQPGANSCNIWAVPTDGGTAIRRITDSDNYYNLGFFAQRLEKVYSRNYEFYSDSDDSFSLR